MQKIQSITLKITSCLLLLAIIILNMPEVSAKHTSGSIGQGTSTNCSFLHGYTNLCSDTKDGGASWHFYRTKDAASLLGFWGGIMSGTQAEQQAEIQKCADSEWILVYGWDGRYNGKYSPYVHYGPLLYPDGAWRPIRYNNYGAKDNTGDITKEIMETWPNGTKVTEEVANKIHQNHYDGASIPRDNTVGAFCSDPGDFLSYFSQSNVSNGDKWETTDIRGPEATTDKLTVDLEVNQSTPIVFSHNIYSSEKAYGAYWQIQKKVYIDGKEPASPGIWIGAKTQYYNPIRYTITDDEPESHYAGEHLDIDQPFTGGGQAKFTPSNRPFTDENGNKYFFRDYFGKVTFKVAGTYKFCETIYLNDEKYTTACITVNVKPTTSYSSISNVSNRDTTTSGGASDYKTTGIVNTPTTARTDNIRLGSSGGKVNITFSHNLYSNLAASGIPYEIVRTVNGSSGFSGNFKINSTGSKPNSSTETDKSTGGKGNANFSTMSGSYYIGSPRNYTDGTNTFILRDFYEVEFPAQDHTYDFCETVYIGDNEYSSSCSKITIGRGSGDPDNPPDDDTPTSVCSTWTPSSYTNSTERSGTTSVIAGTKNNTLGQNWTTSNGNSGSAFNSKPVWAKPGDTIGWIHCYYPGAQKVANEWATKNNNDPEPSRLSGNYNTLNNIRMKDYSGWANWFKVTNDNLKSSNYHYGVFAVGNTSIQEWQDTYTIETGNRSRAGLELTEKNTASRPSSAWANTGVSHSWSCNSYKCNPHDCGSEEHPKTCWDTCYETCYHRNDFYKNDTTMSNAADTAMVKVPYNYTNSASIAIDNSVVYAGETVDIRSASFTVSPKYNGTTNGTYATKVDNAKIRLIAYVSNSDSGSAQSSSNSGDCSAISVAKDSCDIIADRTRNLNDPEDTSGHTDYDFSKSNDSNSVQGTYTYNVYDAPAGKNFCIVAAVYPADSGSSTNMSASGNGKWYISAPSCVKIAKRPSMQVWGGNLYVANKLETTPSTKRVVAGFYDFDDQSNYISGQATSTKNTTVFGSWVEESIVRGNYNEKFDGLASGAATAKYTSDPVNFGGAGNPSNKSPLGGSYEGSANPSLSSYGMPLTFPNTGVTTSSNIAAPTDKSSLLTHFNTETSTNYEYVTDASIGDRNTDPVANPVVLPIGQTKVINSSADTFYIYSNLTYEDGYSTLIEIPKLIIHANNIEIACGVRHIDAVLIAENNINTCNGDINSKANSTPLKIFGSVITDVLTLNRTYGSATGANSTVPAEVIDYDTSLYLWGAPRADSASSGSLDITYQRELSPRY